jgi:MarR family 2-MHQ and catechol resistance regulon transcriptional repressor
VQQFTILENGQISDAAVLNSIEALREDVPNLDETAVEAHMMLFRAYAAYFTTVSTMYEELGLSHARFNMLRWLYHAREHRLTMTELGASLEASVPNVIRMVQGLETDDWVRRVPSEQDRRVMYVELTTNGLERFKRLLPQAIDIWQKLQQGLSSDEQALLSHLLSKLRMSLLSRYIGRDLLAYRIERRKRKTARLS